MLSGILIWLIIKILENVVHYWDAKNVKKNIGWSSRSALFEVQNFFISYFPIGGPALRIPPGPFGGLRKILGKTWQNRVHTGNGVAPVRIPLMTGITTRSDRYHG